MSMCKATLLDDNAVPAAKPESLCEQLEAMIDRASLLDVLTALECVCGEKADHIRANWQDKTTARPWATASKRIGVVARQTEI